MNAHYIVFLSAGQGEEDRIPAYKEWLQQKFVIGGFGNIELYCVQNT